MFLFVLVALVFMPTYSLAWSAPVHRIVARLAWAGLSDATKQTIMGLLGGEDFLGASTWADEVLWKRPETYNWHFVSIPLAATDYRPARDCKPAPRGDCILAALERFHETLGSRSRSVAERREALRFVVHLIGDLHQPMHCIDNRDRNGNAAPVWLPLNDGNVASTLHSAWDGDILMRRGYSENEYFELLNKKRREESGHGDAPVDFVQWALASHQTAVEVAYSDSSNLGKSGSALARAEAEIDRQLLLAGARLAKLLQTALSGG